FDAFQDRPVEHFALDVGARGGHLHHRQRLDQIGIEPQLDAGDVKVLQPACRLDAVIGVGGHCPVAEQVVFESGPVIFHGCTVTAEVNENCRRVPAGSERCSVPWLDIIAPVAAPAAAPIAAPVPPPAMPPTIAPRPAPPPTLRAVFLPSPLPFCST